MSLLSPSVAVDRRGDAGAFDAVDVTRWRDACRGDVVTSQET
jgi:hypothetical protein